LIFGLRTYLYMITVDTLYNRIINVVYIFYFIFIIIVDWVVVRFIWFDFLIKRGIFI